MDDDTPTLEIGFAIRPHGISELERLQAMMNSGEATALKAAAGVERAYSGVKLSGATNEVMSFSGVTTREMARVEKAGDRLTAQLQRQIEQYGKTGAEIRALKVDKLAADFDRLGNAIDADKLRALNAEMTRLEGATGGVAVAAGRGRGTMMQFGMQMNDVVTMGMLGAPVMQIFASQIGQIVQVAQMAEGGVAGFRKELLATTKTILIATATNPLLLGLAAAATAGFLALRAFKSAANDDADMKAYAASLGLTAKEIRNLKDVTVTYGDTAKAVFQVAGRYAEAAMTAVGDAIWGKVGPAVTDIWNVMKGWVDWIGTGVRAGANLLIGGFVGAFNAITASWRQFPAIMGDAFYSAVNAAVGAINSLVQKAVAGVNGFISAANTILAKAGLEIPQLSTPQIATVNNQFAGAGAKFGNTLKAEISKAMGVDYVGKIGAAARGVGNEILDQARLNARNRIRGQATEKGYLDPEKGKSTKDKISDEQKAYEAALKAAQQYIDAQEKLTSHIGKSAKEIRLLEDAAARAKAPTEALKLAIEQAGAAREAAYGAQANKDFEQNVMRPLRDELALYGLVGPARAQAALELEKEAFITKQVAAGVTDAQAAWERYYAAKSALIGKDSAAEREVERVKRLKEELDDLVSRANDAADAMARAFGRVGGAIGDAVALLAEYKKRQDAIDNDKTLSAQKKAAESSRLQLSTTIGLIGATKTLFSEKSKAYKAMEAAEKALAVVQLARTAIDVAGGAAKMFASLGPFGFPAVAAMLAVMASLGFGGGGSAGSYKPKSNDGSGTTLGGRDAKSESLSRSIDALKEVDTVTSVYARQMAASLRSIESQIGGLATILVRSGNLSADSMVSQGFKPNAIGSALGSLPLIGGILGGLFGTKTKVIGSGIYGGAMSLDAILSGAGYDAKTYSDVEKKKKFFGITTSKKFSTVYGGAVDDSVTDQFGLILRSFNDAILAAAGPLGNATDEIKSRLSGFVFSLGKIDLTGLSGTEIQEKLAAVFGAAADNMAVAAFPGIDRFQKVGEGAFETLVRVASTVEAVTDTLGQLGTAVTGLGIDAKVALADQFDTVSDFTNAAASYFDTFYTKEEQATARAAQLTKVFGSMGITMPRTIASFRDLVDAQNLNTDAGRATYATLLQLAPAFSDLMGAMGGAKTAADAAEELRDAWSSIGESIADEVKRIRGLTDSATGGTFASLQGRFNAASLAARGGDQDMARMLPELSQSLLAAAERSATSRQELERVRAVTAASLEATNASIISRTNSLTLDELLDRTATAQAAATQQAADNVVDELRAMNDNLAAELDQLRQDTVAGLAAVAGNTGSTARTLANVAGGGGGDSFQMQVAV